MDSTCKNGLETVLLPLIISISNYYSQKMQIKFSLRSPKKSGQYIPRGRLKFFCFPKRQWARAYTHTSQVDVEKESYNTTVEYRVC